MEGLDAGVAGRWTSFTPANVTLRLACRLGALDAGEWRVSLPASEGPRVGHGPCTPTPGWGRQVEGDRGAWPRCLPPGSHPQRLRRCSGTDSASWLQLSNLAPCEVTTHKHPSSLRTLSSIELHPILTTSEACLPAFSQQGCLPLHRPQFPRELRGRAASPPCLLLLHQ